MTRALGTIAMIATIIVWAGFALSIRGISASTLTVGDVALIRFGLAVLVLSPWIARTWRKLGDERPLTIIVLVIGAGVPYLTISALGGALTSAALVGVVIPGCVPLFVSALMFMVWRQRITRSQIVAVAVIVLGVGVAIAFAPSEATVVGILVLLAAGVLWSIYTLALRHTNLDPIGAALVLCAPSFVVALACVAVGILPSNMLQGDAATQDIVTFALVQGIGVGMVAALCYAFAVRALGAGTAAAFGALSPALTAMLAIPVLGEVPDLGTAVSLALIVAGVLVFHARATRRARAMATALPTALPTATRSSLEGAVR
ncbi:DMT family transporter [Streptomyces sp. ISL-90]|nr:DMT family transporter [Streptomyces sp. ISL-90]